MNERETGGIRAGEILDADLASWAERTWTNRRELAPDDQAFCDIAASHALAKLAALGGSQPERQRFLAKGPLSAWMGEFPWGRAWCASRGGEFWAWAQGDGVKDARVEIAGSIAQWDDDLASAFAESLAAGAVDKPW